MDWKNLFVHIADDFLIERIINILCVGPCSYSPSTVFLLLRRNKNYLPTDDVTKRSKQWFWVSLQNRNPDLVDAHRIPSFIGYTHTAWFACRWWDWHSRPRGLRCSSAASSQSVASCPSSWTIERPCNVNVFELTSDHSLTHCLGVGK